MVRNVLSDSELVKLYCTHVIPLYGSVMLILRWLYDYLFFLEYIWIYKSYDSDDLLLNQMILQLNSEVNDEDKNAEDEEDNASSEEMSNEGANEGTFLFVIDIIALR